MLTIRIALLLSLVLTSFQSQALPVEELEGRLIEVTEMHSKRKFYDVLNGHKLPSGQRVLIGSLESWDHSWLGVCLNKQETCKYDFDYKDRLLQVYKRATFAETEVPKHMAKELSATIMTTTTRFDKGSYAILKIQNNFINSPPKEYKIRFAPGFDKARFDFSSNFVMQSNRQEFKLVNERFRNLASGVIMITRTRSSGTAFLISNKGLLLTNHHVVAGMEGCLLQLKCKMKMEQVLSNGQVESRQVDARVLAADAADDFAILQVDPKEFKNAGVFEIEEQKIGPSVLTLGFPANGNVATETILTYSFGELIGLSDTFYTSSTYIASGASGSPLVNARNFKLIGLTTARYGKDFTPPTGPALSRSMIYLNQTYKIKWYLTGQMWPYANLVVAKLKSAQTKEDVRKVLSEYLKVKTFLGLSAIYEQLATHPQAEVRKAILEELKKAKYIIGA